MPVTATPRAQAVNCSTDSPVTNIPPTLGAISCRNLHILTPASPVDAGTGKQVLTRTHVIKLQSAQKATIEFTLRGPNGNPVDLRDCTCTDNGGSLSLSASVAEGECDCPYKVVFRLREYLAGGTILQSEATIVDAAAGKVAVTLESINTNISGVYFGQFAVIECDSELTDNPTCDTVPIFSNQFYIHVGRNLWGQGSSCGNGPPTIAEIRMALRDSGPAESYLLDAMAFSDEEIAAATWMPIQYWNEIPPSLAYQFSTADFPYRYHWMQAIIGHLFQSCAEQQRRNTLTYSAGGIQIRDQDREPNYTEAAKARLDEWKEFVARKKAEIIYASVYQSVGSPYSSHY